SQTNPCKKGSQPNFNGSLTSTPTSACKRIISSRASESDSSEQFSATPSVTGLGNIPLQEAICSFKVMSSFNGGILNSGILRKDACRARCTNNKCVGTDPLINANVAVDAGWHSAPCPSTTTTSQ